MGALASQITSLTIVYSTVYSDADQRKHQSSASLAFVWGIHRGPVNSPHKWSVTWKMFPFDDVIMIFTLKTPHWLPYKYNIKNSPFWVTKQLCPIDWWSSQRGSAYQCFLLRHIYSQTINTSNQIISDTKFFDFTSIANLVNLMGKEVSAVQNTI